MYNRISYKFILFSVLAHLFLLVGVVFIPTSPDNSASSRPLHHDEKIRIIFHETPEENPLLKAKKEEPLVEEVIEEKIARLIPEKKVLDFSNIPEGEEPEKAVVYGRKSTRARNDFYENKSDSVQQSKTMAALPQQSRSRLLLRKRSPSVDGRISRKLSEPAKAITRMEQDAQESKNLRAKEPEVTVKDTGERAMPLKTRPPKPGSQKPAYEKIQQPEKREIIKEKNIFARLIPDPGERGLKKEIPEAESELPMEIREKVREPRILEKDIDRLDRWKAGQKPASDRRKPEISASRDLGLELGGPPDVYEMIALSIERLEQSPDIPSIDIEEHASIKNSDQDSSNESKTIVVSLDTQELKYVSYFWHLKQKISNVWSYPSDAVRMGMQGTVIVRMSLLKTGRLEKVQLIRSSGFSLLDIEARDAVISAGPFPPFPEQIIAHKLIIEGYFRYLGQGWNGSRRQN